MKRMLADVLWEAANKGLRHASDDYDLPAASCHAVTDAVWKGKAGNRCQEEERAMQFLCALGCDTDRYQFSEYGHGEERQGVRYMWLLLAMHVAEDEGIEI